MLNAIIQNQKGEAAVVDLTVNFTTLYREIHTIGQYLIPEQLFLRD